MPIGFYDLAVLQYNGNEQDVALRISQESTVVLSLSDLLPLYEFKIGEVRNLTSKSFQALNFTVFPGASLVFYQNQRKPDRIVHRCSIMGVTCFYSISDLAVVFYDTQMRELHRINIDSEVIVKNYGMRLVFHDQEKGIFEVSVEIARGADFVVRLFSYEHAKRWSFNDSFYQRLYQISAHTSKCALNDVPEIITRADLEYVTAKFERQIRQMADQIVGLHEALDAQANKYSAAALEITAFQHYIELKDEYLRSQYTVMEQQKGYIQDYIEFSNGSSQLYYLMRLKSENMQLRASFDELSQLLQGKPSYYESTPKTAKEYYDILNRIEKLYVMRLDQEQLILAKQQLAEKLKLDIQLYHDQRMVETNQLVKLGNRFVANKYAEEDQEEIIKLVYRTYHFTATSGERYQLRFDYVGYLNVFYKTSYEQTENRTIFTYLVELKTDSKQKTFYICPIQAIFNARIKEFLNLKILLEKFAEIVRQQVDLSLYFPSEKLNRQRLESAGIEMEFIELQQQEDDEHAEYYIKNKKAEKATEKLFNNLQKKMSLTTVQNVRYDVRFSFFGKIVVIYAHGDENEKAAPFESLQMIDMKLKSVVFRIVPIPVEFQARYIDFVEKLQLKIDYFQRAVREKIDMAFYFPDEVEYRKRYEAALEKKRLSAETQKRKAMESQADALKFLAEPRQFACRIFGEPKLINAAIVMEKGQALVKCQIDDSVSQTPFREIRIIKQVGEKCIFCIHDYDNQLVGLTANVLEMYKYASALVLTEKTSK